MNNQEKKWIIDPMHSNIEFKIRHMVITTVTGHFKQFESEVITENNDFTTAKIRFSANISGIESGNPDRNGHLMSDDFFNAEKFPTLNFEGTKMEKSGDEEFVLHGNLTIRDVSKPIQLKVNYGGTIKDFYGNHRAGFEVTGSIKRKDFDLKWNAFTEAGGAVVSDEVRIVCNVQYTTPIVAEVSTEAKA